MNVSVDYSYRKRMQATQLILLIICLLKYNLSLKSCTEKHEKVAVCFTNIEGYVEPIPADLETWLYLNEIIKIDGDQNAFEIHVELTTYWSDPGLALSDGSE